MGRLSHLPSRLGAAPYRVGQAPDKAASAPPHVDRNAAPWRRWYGTARWKALRLATFVRDLFTCQMCGHVEGDTSQLVCDHRNAHRGDPVLFWDPLNLQTLCKSPCHDKHKQQQEQASLAHRGVWD